MHSKLKGNIAFSAVTLALQKAGINVFSEIGDYSKIDLIAEINSVCVKIQIKYSGSDKDKATLRLKKSGPNGYRYTYSEKDVDYFAIYHDHSEKIAWISSKDALEERNTMVIFRVEPPKNNQKIGINLIDDYSVDKFISNYIGR